MEGGYARTHDQDGPSIERSHGLERLRVAVLVEADALAHPGHHQRHQQGTQLRNQRQPRAQLAQQRVDDVVQEQVQSRVRILGCSRTQESARLAG